MTTGSKTRSVQTLRRRSRVADRDAWVDELAGADTCVAPILEPAEVAGDAQYRHRGVFVEAEHPAAGRFRQVGPLLAGMQPAGRRAAGVSNPEEPVLLPDADKTQTLELLEAAGVPAEKVADMQSRGVLA